MKIFKIVYKKRLTVALFIDEYDVKDFLENKNKENYEVKTFDGTLNTLNDVGDD